MPMIFPGMDPYLETPEFFPGIHGPMVTYIRDQIAPGLQPRYLVSVGERVYVQWTKDSFPNHAIIPDVWIRHTNPGRSSGRSDQQSAVAVLDAEEPVLLDIPEPEVRESFVEILDRESDMKVVTIIELISPTNKYAGTGRDNYLARQHEVRYSDTHMVEIDLLRRGPHVLAVNEGSVAARYNFDYLTCVHRGHAAQFEVYPTTLRQKLPRIRIPLAGSDPDVRLDVRAALEKAYDAGGYRHRIDYSKPCVPPLTTDDQAWADELIRNAPSVA